MKLKNVLLSLGLAALCVVNTGCSKTPSGNTAIAMTFKDGDKIAEITIQGYGTIKAKLFPDLAPNAVKNFIELADSKYYDGLKIHRVAKDMCIQGGSLYGDGTGGEAVINTDGFFDNEINEEARHIYGALCYANLDGKNTTQFYVVTSQAKTDITNFSPAVIREKAKECTDKKAELEENDPELDYLTAQEAYYTNLATMIEKASYDAAAKYMTTGGYPLWDGYDTVFGQVFEGFEVLDALNNVEVTTASSGLLEKPTQDLIIESVVITDYATPEPEPEKSSKKKK